MPEDSYPKRKHGVEWLMNSLCVLCLDKHEWLEDEENISKAVASTFEVVRSMGWPDRLLRPCISEREGRQFEEGLNS